jgi:hypothetical protein
LPGGSICRRKSIEPPSASRFNPYDDPLPAPSSPTAASITVRQTLDLLDGPFASLSNGFVRGEYSLWLGSGLSRDRIIGLNGVLHKLIEFLRIRANPGNGNPYKRALDDVLAHANLSDAERARVSYATESANWGDLQIILQRLIEKYSTVLNVTVSGQVPDYLLWNGTSFPETFSTEEPDAEHLCVAILALEGVVTNIASANWDGLLEAAANELGQDQTLYRVCITEADFRGPSTAARLLKFHGCAIRAIQQEAVYRRLLIARSSQIVDWILNPNFQLMREELVSLAAQNRTLMIGMSAQDVNVKQIFGAARNRLEWNWSDDPPPHVFAEDRIGTDQQTILQIAYGEAAFASNESAILDRSCLRAYAKSLLVALVLKVIASKICALMREVTAPGLGAADFDELARGVDQLRNLAAGAAEPDRLAFVRALVRHLSRAKAILQEGRSVAEVKPRYRPISHRPMHIVPYDPNLTPTGQREAASALALFGLGHAARHWTVQADDPDNPRSGAMKIVSPNGSARAFFVAHTTEAIKLFKDGVYSEDEEDVILVHSTERVEQQQRSPSREFGRHGKPGVRHIEMNKMLRTANGIADLNHLFLREIVP